MDKKIIYSLISIILIIGVIASLYYFIRQSGEEKKEVLKAFNNEVVKFQYPNDWEVTEEDKYFGGSENAHQIHIKKANNFEVFIAYDLKLHECELPEGRKRTGGAACENNVQFYFDKDDFIVLNNKNSKPISRYKNLEPKQNTDLETSEVWIGENITILNNSFSEVSFIGDGGIDFGFEIGKIKNLMILYSFTESQKPDDLLKNYATEIKQADDIIGSLIIAK